MFRPKKCPPTFNSFFSSKFVVICVNLRPEQFSEKKLSDIIFYQKKI